MQYAPDLAEHHLGARTGKLLSEPDVWFPVNAQLAGIDPWSDSPQERLRYMVFQRKMEVEALQTKAILMALVNPEKAEKAAQDYFAVIMPVSDAEERRREWLQEQQLKAIEQMGPIPLSEVSFGQPLGKEGATVSERPRRTAKS